MAERLAPGDYDQLHHFVAAGVWDAAPLETELLIQADRLVGGSDAVLVIDDTAVPKKGTHSVGVAAQYASALGKTGADQQDGPQRCTRHRTNDASGALPSGACKTLRSQKLRMLLTHRKLLQSKAIAIENDLRGTLRSLASRSE